MERILLLIDGMGQGGAERQMAYLAIGLKNKGHDVRLIRFYDGENAYSIDLDNAKIDTETAKCGTSRILRPFYIAKVIKTWKPNKVIAYKDGVCMAACLTKLIINFKLIVSERNTTQNLSIYERLKFQLYRFADWVIPNSQSQAELIRTHAKWLSNKISVITNMIDTEKFRPRKRNKTNSIPTIITTARISPQKNILNYLIAIKQIKEKGILLHFDWYGKSEVPEYYDLVKNSIKELDIGDYITFHDGIHSIELNYNESDYFCLPSSYEGFPNVLCEAMASGLVCSASDVCDNPYILTNPKFRFNPQNPESISETICNLINLAPIQKDNISLANRNFILELCAPDSFICKYESL